MRAVLLSIALLTACSEDPSETCDTDVTGTDMDGTDADTDADTQPAAASLLVFNDSFELPVVTETGPGAGAPLPAWWEVEHSSAQSIAGNASAANIPIDPGNDGAQFGIMVNFPSQQGGESTATLAPLLVVGGEGVEYSVSGLFASTDDAPPTGSEYALEVLIEGTVVASTPIPLDLGVAEMQLQPVSVSWTSDFVDIDARLQIRLRATIGTSPSQPSFAYGFAFDDLRLQLTAP